MNIQKFIQPQDISENNIVSANDEFYVAIADPSNSEKIFKALHNFFVTNKYALELVVKYYKTYWKWYVELTWDNIYSLSKEEFADAVAYQMPTAFRLGKRVDLLSFSYISKVSDSTTDWGNIYDDIHGTINYAEYKIAPDSGDKSPTNKEVGEQLKLISQIDDIDQAKFVAKVQDLFFGEDNALIPVGSAKAKLLTEQFLITLDFYYKKHDIIEGLRDYLEEKGSTGELKYISTMSFLGVDPEIQEEVMKEIQNGALGSIEPISETESTVSGENLNDSSGYGFSSQSYSAIRTQVEATFPSDDTGQFLEVEDVFEFLENMAEQTGDKKILDLYYFDEGLGEFRWNDELLNS